METTPSLELCEQLYHDFRITTTRDGDRRYIIHGTEKDPSDYGPTLEHKDIIA